MRRHTKTTSFPFDTSINAASTAQSETKPIITTVLIPLGSFLVAGLALLVQAVPWWVTGIVVFYVVVVALVGLIPASIRTYRLLRSWMRQRAVAHRYTPLIRRFLTTLVPNLEESRADTVFNVWKSAIPLDQGRNQVRPDYAHLRTLQSWLRSIDSRLEVDGRSNFDQLCSELAEVVLQYNRLCEQAHREIEAIVIGGKAEDHQIRYLKQEWNNARDKHNQTIKAWEDLAKNINHDAGERICFDHGSFLKTVG
ncbi:hypothetical protein [Sulfuricaulis limicola]|uniref:hypothetical protein n=1 Tax=Sulfuricaulis limicola TaxID=1620215 RepID=UPI0011E4D3DE|nr:hypothetical protein [Sulfuricaulis limicola]